MVLVLNDISETEVRPLLKKLFTWAKTIVLFIISEPLTYILTEILVPIE
jgi:hypothetical protein